MGLYIESVEMPKGNDELRLIIRSNGQVIISHKTYYEETEAVPVPAHGDLIGSKPIFKSLLSLCKKCTILGMNRYQKKQTGKASGASSRKRTFLNL